MNNSAFVWIFKEIKYWVTSNSLKRIKRLLPAIVIFCFAFLARTGVRGQCAPALQSCAGCTNLTGSNLNISSGTYCVTGSISNLNLSGTAVICISGAGQINGGNIIGGTIIYNGSTASNPLNVSISGGTLRIRSSITLINFTSIGGSSTVVVENAVTLTVSNLDVNGKLYVDQDSRLYVNGAFGVNGGGAVCLSNGLINTNTFTKNDQRNSTTTTSKGCYAIRSSVSNFNQVLTNSSSVFVCLPAAAPNPNKFGSATLNPNCSNTSADGGCLAALPVRLVSFQARSFGEGVRLNWASSLEQNFDYYQVERSSDAVRFEAISPHITSLKEHTSTQQYEWTDVNAQAGTFYYRLKQVDLDNTHSYSKIVGVVFHSDDNAATIWPNPFSDALSVTLSTPTNGTYTIEIYLVTGKLYSSLTGEKNETTITRTIAMNVLPAGSYFANIHMGDQHFMRKVIKQ